MVKRDFKASTNRIFLTKRRLWYGEGIIFSTREGFFCEVKTDRPVESFETSYSFLPEEEMTRAQVITTIMRTDIPKIREYDGCYQDVYSTAWYYDEIKRAYEAGLLEKSEYLYPNKPATREFVAKMLSVITASSTESKELPFSDAGTIAADCKDGVSLLYSHGVIGSYPDGTFQPQKSVTRAEYAVILGRLIQAKKLTVYTPNERFALKYARSFSA